VVQPEDDVPYTLPMIPHREVVHQVPEIDQCLDIRVQDDGGISTVRFQEFWLSCIHACYC
jgi:hypothetical protein